MPGDRWFADETYVKVAGRWVYLYRAIDQYGQVIDVLVSEKRDLAATRRFFTRALDHGTLWVPNWSSTAVTCGIAGRWSWGVIVGRGGSPAVSELLSS